MFFIKDLKDLDNVTTRSSIDIKDLKDLDTHRNDGDRGGQAPALRRKNVTLPRRAWALGCHTRIRADFPRHRSRCEKTPLRSVGPECL